MSEPISDRKIKFALVGCGRISNNHFGSFEVLQEDCELVAVCDIDPAALEAAVKRTGAKGYARYTEMLAETDADVIVITTPSGFIPSRRLRHWKLVFTSSPKNRWRPALRTANVWFKPPTKRANACLS